VTATPEALELIERLRSAHVGRRSGRWANTDVPAIERDVREEFLKVRTHSAACSGWQRGYAVGA
jgi:hypothetical protein